MGCCEGVPKLCVFTGCGQFYKEMRKYMILIKKFDAQTHIKTSLSLHREFRRDIYLAHQLMHIHKIVYIKTFKRG
jgi:hypothetical protein